VNEKSEVVAEKCSFNLISFYLNQSRGKFQSIKCSDNAHNLIHSSYSEVIIENCFFENGKYSQILVLNKSSADISNCIIKNNEYSGIGVRN
jgi:hypothetical protein